MVAVVVVFFDVVAVVDSALVFRVVLEVRVVLEDFCVVVFLVPVVLEVVDFEVLPGVVFFLVVVVFSSLGCVVVVFLAVVVVVFFFVVVEVGVFTDCVVVSGSCSE